MTASDRRRTQTARRFIYQGASVCCTKLRCPLWRSAGAPKQLRELRAPKLQAQRGGAGRGPGGTGGPGEQRNNATRRQGTTPTLVAAGVSTLPVAAFGTSVRVTSATISRHENITDALTNHQQRETQPIF